MNPDENVILTKALEVLLKMEKGMRNKDIREVGPGLPPKNTLAQLSAVAGRLKFSKEYYYNSLSRFCRI